MPYYTRDVMFKPDALIERLAKELNTTPELLPEEGPRIEADSPTIVEEVGLLGRINVTVVWDAWKQLPPEHRGHVILQAYKRAKGEAEMLRIGLAMGLTRSEQGRILPHIRQAG